MRQAKPDQRDQDAFFALAGCENPLNIEDGEGFTVERSTYT
jgi:hypothetical protein